MRWSSSDAGWNVLPHVKERFGRLSVGYLSRSISSVCGGCNISVRQFAELRTGPHSVECALSVPSKLIINNVICSPRCIDPDIFKIIFLFCGLLTVVFSVVVFIVLPDSPMTARFLKGDDKLLAVERLRYDHAKESLTLMEALMTLPSEQTIKASHPESGGGTT